MKKKPKLKEVKSCLIGDLSPHRRPAEEAWPKRRGISQRGRIIIACGIGLLVIGFFTLTKANPEGSNWASIVSPILIIGGYVTIGIGIIL